jgi:hypothetical protein
LYRNNDLTNFNIDDFDTPTGQLVTGIPVSIEVNPGETSLVSFGSFFPDTYELALADAAPLSDSSDTYSKVGDEAVLDGVSMQEGTLSQSGIVSLAVSGSDLFVGSFNQFTGTVGEYTRQDAR